MTTDEWVKRVNQLAFEIDEIAASIHPSAWAEALEPLFEKYQKLAKVMPDDELPARKTRKKKRDDT